MYGIHMFDPPVALATAALELNPDQTAAVQHRGSPLLVVAGAGTGKTRTLTARVVSLLDDGVDAERILLLTFSRRAAAEMLCRVSAATHRRAATRMWGGTFHAIANRLLRTFARAAGVDTGFTVLDRADTVDMLAMVRTTEGLAERGRRLPRAATVAAIYSRMVNSQAKLDEVLAADFGWCADHADTLRSMFVAYTERKRSSRVLDYDDLLLFWRGLTAGPAGDELRAMFSHVLIDEYQDTNRIQADIVSGMCGPATEVCAVGDDAQSIYGFRAATVANMWTFADRFPGARTITLEQSYRSTMPVLAVANAVLAQPAAYARAHHPKTLWSTRRGGPRPGLIVHHDEGDQSRSVARSVLEARERGIDLRHQAVLFRAGHHSDGLELELARHDIPFVKYGGLEYLETAHVKDLLALLRLLDNPADELAWHRVLGLLAGVGPATIRRITAELGLDDHAGADPGARAELSGRDALGRFLHAPPRFPPAAADQAQELRAALADCAGAELSPSAQIARLAGFCELVFPARYDNAPARIADLGQLAATATVHHSRQALLVELTLDPPSRTSDLAGPPSLDDDWLTLSTIHSAKGLEWRAVHLIHATDGNIPSDMAIRADGNESAGLAEELRLLYVALTRARDELTVHVPLRCHVNRFATDDRHVYGQLSRFLEPVRSLFGESAGDHDDVDDHDGPRGTRVPVALPDEVDALLTALWGA